MDEGHKLTDKKLEKLIRKLDKVYSQAAKETEVKLNDYMRRFKVKDDIKLQQVKSGELDYQEWVDWRIGQIMVGKRWEEMRDTLAEDLTHVDEIATQMVGESMHEVYALNHNFGTFEAEKGSLVDTSYTLYDRHTVERLVRDNPTLLKAPTLTRTTGGMHRIFNRQLHKVSCRVKIFAKLQSGWHSELLKKTVMRLFGMHGQQLPMQKMPVGAIATSVQKKWELNLSKCGWLR